MSHPKRCIIHWQMYVANQIWMVRTAPSDSLLVFLKMIATISCTQTIFERLSAPLISTNNLYLILNIVKFVYHQTQLSLICMPAVVLFHDDVIKWKHFPRYRPFVRGIHRSPVNSPHKGQWRGALMFSLICGWINRWVNSRGLRRCRAHYDVIVM